MIQKLKWQVPISAWNVEPTGCPELEFLKSLWGLGTEEE
jgi:hypothetical protein